MIRILDVQDLCARTGLPYDPIPWSEPTSGPAPAPRALLLAGPILALLAAAWIRFGKSPRTRGKRSLP